MEPREARRPWTIFSAVGNQTPVQHLALNLGAPGDRKDGSGNVWFSYPRYEAYRETSLDVKLDLKAKFGADGRFESLDDQFFDRISDEHHWLYTSWANDLRQLTLSLVTDESEAGDYQIPGPSV